MRRHDALYVFLFVAWTLLQSCGGNGDVRRLLDRADSLLSSRPDSSLSILDGLLSDSTHHGRRQLMHCRLLRLNACNKLDTVFTSAHAAQAEILARYFDRHGTPDEQLLAHYLLGRTYADMGETPHALKCYLEAIAKADTLDRNCDNHTLGCAYSQMAEIFHRQLLYSDEIVARKQAQHYATISGETLNAISDMELCAGAYLLLNKKDTAEMMLKDASGLYRKYGYEQEALQTTNMLMYLYADQSERLDELKQLIDQYDAESQYFDSNHELQGVNRQYYYYKGKYFEHTNQLDSAEYYYRKIYYPDASYISMVPMYSGLLSIYTKLQQADSIARYARLYCGANDSSVIISGQQLTAQLAAIYRYNSIQKEAFENQSKAYKLQTMLILSILLLLLIVMVGTYFFNLYRKKRADEAHKKEQALQQLKAEFADAAEAYEDNLYELRQLEATNKKVVSIIKNEMQSLNTEKAQYKAKLEDAQRTIAKINQEYEESTALLAEENAVLKRRIDELKSQESFSHCMQQTIAFSETDIAKLVKDMVENPLSKMTQHHWDMLYKTFTEFYPVLCQDLVAMKFNTNTVRICMLTMLIIRNQDQANLMGINKQLVTNCKSHLNSKLFHEKTSKTLFANLMSRYDV